MRKVLSMAQQGDIADSEMRFAKQYAEALGDNWREELQRRKQEQFDLNPVCGVCNERIDDIEGAALWEPVNQSAMLLCTKAECFTKTLQMSLGRYLQRGRRRSA